MSKKDFPEKVTKNSFPQLIEKAKRIKKRAFLLMIVSVIVYGILGFLIMPIVLYLVGWFLMNSLPELSSESFIILWLLVFGLVFIPTLFLLLDSIIRFFERYLGLPKSEEKVFAGCFLIANHLMNNEKTKAIKGVNDFVMYLSDFLKDRNNLKRKVYAPEFNLLISGKTEIRRMLLFSKEKIPELLMNFGLSFVRGEDQEAFSSLTRLVERVKIYGEPRGRFRRFLAGLEQYPTFFNFLLSMAIFVVSVVLAILGILPYI